MHEALALSAHGADANATATALAVRFSDTSWQRVGGIPFSSARKWSAVSAAGNGTWVLGAPEMVLPEPSDDAARDARMRADDIAAQGRRVLLLACVPTEVHGEPEDAALPVGLTPSALIVLAERIREDAPDTMRYFTDQGVALKVISGDNPRTVGAVAASVGVPGVSGANDAVDARTLPDDLDELGDVLETHSVFGRVTPHQKRAVVAALQRKGHVVAMTGDGVNDAMALKDAQIGVAMGNGSAATRAVAQLVLLDGRFSHLPNVVAEGRRVIANIERAAIAVPREERLLARSRPDHHRDRHRLPAGADPAQPDLESDDRCPGVLPRAGAEQRRYIPPVPRSGTADLRCRGSRHRRRRFRRVHRDPARSTRPRASRADRRSPRWSYWSARCRRWLFLRVLSSGGRSSLVGGIVLLIVIIVVVPTFATGVFRSSRADCGSGRRG